MKLRWLEILERELAAGRWCALATVVEARATDWTRPGQKMLLLSNGSLRGDLGCPELALRLAEAFQQQRGFSYHYEIFMPLEGGGEVRAVAEIHAPVPELLILGAGHVGKALAQIAHFAGLSVLVADDRASFSNPDRFPMARQCFTGDWPELLPTLPTHDSSYVVICTRGHAFDELAVGAMLSKPGAYVGLLGSRRKAVEIFKSLEAAGVPREKLERVHCPVGLPIGAETPEEIAVSIVAEILSLARSKERFKVQRINA